MYTNGMHAKQPTKETNLSKSFAPNQATFIQNNTKIVLNRFLNHFTFVLYFPDLDLLKILFSMIPIAGKSCNGVDNKIAKE